MRSGLRYLSLLSAMMIPQFLRGNKIDKLTGDTVPVKPRYVAGDRFYSNLQFKRVKGKWVVKR